MLSRLSLKLFTVISNFPLGGMTPEYLENSKYEAFSASVPLIPNLASTYKIERIITY